MVALLRRKPDHQAGVDILSSPGQPDFVWPNAAIAVFVDGCFWHGHDCGRNLSSKDKYGVLGEVDSTTNRSSGRIGQSDELDAKGWVDRCTEHPECTLADHLVRALSRSSSGNLKGFRQTDDEG